MNLENAVNEKWCRNCVPPKPVAFFGNGFGGLWAWGFELGPKKLIQGTVWDNYDNVMATRACSLSTATEGFPYQGENLISPTEYISKSNTSLRFCVYSQHGLALGSYHFVLPLSHGGIVQVSRVVTAVKLHKIVVTKSSVEPESQCYSLKPPSVVEASVFSPARVLKAHYQRLSHLITSYSRQDWIYDRYH